MRSREEIKRRGEELLAEIEQKQADYKAGRITDKNYYEKCIQRLASESEELAAERKALDQTKAFSWGAEPAAFGVGTMDMGDASAVPGASGYERIMPASPMDLSHGQIQQLA